MGQITRDPLCFLSLGKVSSRKERMINVRLSSVVHDQFKIACRLRGGSMSSILHQFIVRTIREERELEPNAFRDDSSELAKVDKRDDRESKGSRSK